MFVEWISKGKNYDIRRRKNNMAKYIKISKVQPSWESKVMPTLTYDNVSLNASICVTNHNCSMTHWMN